jgi:flagellar protein FliS
MDVGGELPHNLSALYDYMVRRLLHANLRNDVAAISEVEALLNNIADAWKQIGPSSPSLQDVF